MTSPNPMVPPTGPKPNAIVHPRYDAKGKDAPWVHAYIRPVPNMPATTSESRAARSNFA